MGESGRAAGGAALRGWRRVAATDDVGSTGAAYVDPVDAVAIAGGAFVAVLTVVALAMAHAGWHRVWTVTVVSVAVALAAAMVWRSGVDRPVRLAGVGSFGWALLSVLVVATVFFVPGFRYAHTDKDPGIYVVHAEEIARTGSVWIDSTPLQRSGVLTERDVPGAQWRAFSAPDSSGRILPSFFHAWPAVLAVAIEVLGFRALSLAVPLLALLGVLLVGVLGRRLGGPVAGVVAAAVMAVNQMNVWQARYPSAEILAQVLFLTAAFALVLAMPHRSGVAAATAGLALTAGFLTRGEAIVLVLLGAWGACLTIVSRRGARVASWLLVGLVVPLPLGLWQAYGPAAAYARTNGVPSLPTVAALLAAAVVVALVGTLLLPTMTTSVASKFAVAVARVGQRLRWFVAVGVIAAFALAVVRPVVFAPSTMVRNGEVIRSFDEQSLWRLSWFFGWPALLVALVGTVYALAVQPRAERVVVIGTCTAFTALFLVHARNSPQMMWWGRRFVPVVVPGLALATGVGIGALRDRWSGNRRRVAAVLALAVVLLARQAVPTSALIGHHERSGSYAVTLEIAGVAGGDDAVFLWERGRCCRSASHLYGSAVWLRGDVDSALLPEGDAARRAYVRRVHGAVPGARVFLVMHTDEVPADVADLAFVERRIITGVIPFWEERTDGRPSRAQDDVFAYRVYEVTFGS